MKTMVDIMDRLEESLVSCKQQVVKVKVSTKALAVSTCQKRIYFMLPLIRPTLR
jgi:hypothetical protein